MGKYSARVHFLRHAPGLLRDRLAAYHTYGTSVLQYLGQHAAPPADLAQQESAALAALLAAPMHAITPQAMWGLACCACPLRFAPAPVMLDTASIRFVLWHHILGDTPAPLEALRQMDEAMILPRAPAWAWHGSLRRAMVLRRQASPLPAERARCAEAAMTPDPRVGLRAPRAGSVAPAAFEPHLAQDEAVQFVRIRLRHAFSSLPVFVAMALVRTIPNTWPASRQIARHADACFTGCAAVGGDDIRHYVVCPTPRMHMAVWHFPAPPWHSLGTMVVPAAGAELSDCWLYNLYRTIGSARHTGDLRALIRTSPEQHMTTDGRAQFARGFARNAVGVTEVHGAWQVVALTEQVSISCVGGRYERNGQAP